MGPVAPLSRTQSLGTQGCLFPLLGAEAQDLQLQGSLPVGGCDPVTPFSSHMSPHAAYAHIPFKYRIPTSFPKGILALCH